MHGKFLQTILADVHMLYVDTFSWVAKRIWDTCYTIVLYTIVSEVQRLNSKILFTQDFTGMMPSGKLT
jgi:hypothetical protein